MGLIDVDKAKSVIMDEVVAPDWFKTVACMALSNIPTVDPVKHGYWVFDERWWYSPRCSVCNRCPDTPGFLGKEDFYRTKFCFCPNCGAKMDEKAD